MPEFLHPSVRTTVTDNSFVFQTAQGTTVLYAPIIAQRGIDNKLVRLTTTDEALFMFGEPNITAYGQSFYNVIEWLKAGGEAYVVRVVPDYARFATTVLYAATISGSYDPDGPTTAFPVKTVMPYLAPLPAAPVTEITVAESPYETPSAVSIGAIETAISNVAFDAMSPVDNSVAFGSDILTVGGVNEKFNRYPITIFSSKGRSTYYNKLGVRIRSLDNYDSTFNFRTYEIEFTLEDLVGNDVRVDGPYIVSFDKLAINRNRESVFIDNVINKYSQFVQCLTNTENLEDVLTFLAPSGVALNQIDFLFGKNRKIKPVPTNHNLIKTIYPTPSGTSYTSDSDSLVSVNRLGNGGSTGFASTGTNSEQSMLVSAFDGTLVPEILDKKQYRFDVTLDGNFPSSVKNAMCTLANVQRQDMIAIADVGFKANVTQTLDFRDQDLQVSDYHSAIFCQDLVVFDSYTGRDIKVTPTYQLAGKIPFNDDRYGIQYPFVGPLYGTISGFSSINFIPNEIQKESLYTSQINYIEKDPKRTNFGSQLTSQTMNSALSDINNVRALLRMIREVEDICADYRMQFNDDITLEQVNYNIANAMQRWISNRTCSELTVKVYRSDYDRQQKIARVKLECVFTGIIERFFIDWSINR